jgi:hypothetical protein
MKRTHYLTATVQSENRLEIELPDLSIGQTVEVILIVAEKTVAEKDPASAQLIDRKAFLKLPLEERRRILEQQAEAVAEYYQQDQEWKEWLSFDAAKEYDYET